MKAVVISLVAGAVAGVVIYLVMGTGREKTRKRVGAVRTTDTPTESPEELKQTAGKDQERVIPTREWTGGNR